MRTPLSLAAGLALIILLLVAAAAAQTPGGGAGAPAGAAPGLYNPQTVETVSGVVVSVPATKGQEGFPEPARLILDTGAGKIPVVLGPAWFVAQQGLKIAPLDKIAVTGSRITIKGKPALVAAEIKKGGQVMELRDKQTGAPRWGRGGK
jgi:hypothetical protein